MAKFRFKPNKDIDHSGTTNAHRASFAEDIMNQWRNAHYFRDYQLEDYHLADLISDLGHYADQQKLDFNDILQSGREMWEEER